VLGPVMPAAPVGHAALSEDELPEGRPPLSHCITRGAYMGAAVSEVAHSQERRDMVSHG